MHFMAFNSPLTSFFTYTMRWFRVDHCLCVVIWLAHIYFFLSPQFTLFHLSLGERDLNWKLTRFETAFGIQDLVGWPLAYFKCHNRCLGNAQNFLLLQKLRHSTQPESSNKMKGIIGQTTTSNRQLNSMMTSASFFYSHSRIFFFLLLFAHSVRPLFLCAWETKHLF